MTGAAVAPARPAGRARAGQLVVALGALAALALLAHHVRSSATGPRHAALDHGALMAALMVPLAAPTAVLAVQRALRRRWRAVVVAHVAGYAAAWFAFAAPVAATVAAASAVVEPWLVFGALLAVAGGWQLSHRRWLATQRPGWLRAGPAFGWAAVLSDARAGADQATRCIRTCGVAMAVMAAAPAPVLLGVVYAAGISEFFPGPSPHASHRRLRPALAYAVLSALAATVVVA